MNTTSTAAATTCQFCDAHTARPTTTRNWVGTREDGHWEQATFCGSPECWTNITYNRPRAPRRTKAPIVANDYNLMCAFLGTGNGLKKSRRASA